MTQTVGEQGAVTQGLVSRGSDSVGEQGVMSW